MFNTNQNNKIIRELAQRVPQHGDALMTIAQQLESRKVIRLVSNVGAKKVNLMPP